MLSLVAPPSHSPVPHKLLLVANHCLAVLTLQHGFVGKGRFRATRCLSAIAILPLFLHRCGRGRRERAEIGALAATNGMGMGGGVATILPRLQLLPNQRCVFCLLCSPLVWCKKASCNASFLIV